MSFLLPSVKQILEESEGTVQVEPSTVDLIIEAFKTRIKQEKHADQETPHAEALIRTTETDEFRTDELLKLAENMLTRVLVGNHVVATVDVKVLTGQPNDSASINIYAAGLDLARVAYGLFGRSVTQIEDFLASRVSTEFQLLLHRFLDKDVLDNINLNIKMEASGRSLAAVSRQKKALQPELTSRHLRQSHPLASAHRR